MKKVLIIDDDTTLRKLFATLLGRKGFVASEAADGEEAIALLTDARKENGQTEYSLVLLDLDMPKLSGLDVLAFIKRSMPEMVKSIAVISAASGSQLRDLEDRGACGTTLQKPFDVEIFYRKIAGCIREVPRSS